MGANLSTFPDISVSERFVPGPEGAPEVPVLVYLPIAAQAPLSALLWIHGGGSVMGEASQDDLAVSQIVSAVRCVAVSVDYRLAPETPHPGQIEDGYAALRWLSTHAGELGVDPARIAIGGASAGGGLSAGLALLTRDRGEMPHLFLEEDLEYARRRVAGRCAHRVACLSWRVPWLQSGGSSLGLAIRTARSGRCASLALFTNPQKRQALRRNIQWIDEEHTFRKKRAIHIFSENFT